MTDTQISKIYKITITQAYMMDELGDGYGLSPYGTDTMYYNGYDDGGVDYLIPDGYTEEDMSVGGRAIYDNNGDHCAILSHNDESLLLISCNGIKIIKKV